MSRPLLRGSFASRVSGGFQDFFDSQMKDKNEKEDVGARKDSFDPSHTKFASQLNHLSSSPSKYNSIENGFVSDSISMASSRNCQKYIMLLLRFSLFFIAATTIYGSFWWAVTISTSSRVQINQHYRVLQERVLSDLWDVGELSLGSPKSRELEFCSEDYENYVPCYSISESIGLADSDGSNVFERHCGYDSRQTCLIIPPLNYKIPLRWPTGKDFIWVANVKITAQQVLSSGSITKRMMILEEEQISFRSTSFTFDGIEDYAQQVAKMIGLTSESDFVEAGVRTVLDIGCGYGSFGAHLFSKQLLTMCIANYETSGSQVQLNLERGLPAMIASFTSKQLPFPSLSFDMLHCLRCGINWDQKGGIFLMEADRVLRPGGYFVWTSPLTNSPGNDNNNKKKGSQKKPNFVIEFADNLCWELVAQQDETIVWKKASKTSCYASRKLSSAPPICGRGMDVESPFYRPLLNCISGINNKRWIPIEAKRTWPSRANLNQTELKLYGVDAEEFAEDSAKWRMVVRDYWSLLSPLIFSDHPKRPGDEDPSAPYNMFRNVLDMNSHYGGLNSALLEAGKNLWVMNVVPTNGPNYLPAILDRGFIGVLHDWCEAFPTYPRTYDMVHAAGLLTHMTSSKKQRCSMLDVFTEIDRLLRPEGWVIIRDTSSLIELGRALSVRLKWDARVVEVESNTDEKLLFCQKPFFKRQQQSSLK